MKNYYHLLGVETDASIEEIKTAYRKLSKKFHPDVNGGDAFFEQQFKEIQEAYEVLCDPAERKSYDMFLAYMMAGGPGGDSHHMAPPEIIRFEANRTYVNEGEEITLRWETRHAMQVQLVPVGEVAPKGEKTLRCRNIANRKQIEFELAVFNDAGSAGGRIIVGVGSPVRGSVVVEGPPIAGKWRRLANAIVDYMAAGFLIGLATVFYEPLRELNDWTLLYGGTVIYYWALEGLTGQTLGKMFTGTCVVTEDGFRPSGMTILGRTLCRLIPLEALSFLGKRGWHDSLSATQVVRITY